MAIGQYVNPEDEFSDLWRVPQRNAAESYGNADKAASLADPWSKYRENFAKMANTWGQDPSQIGALPGVKWQFDKGMDAASRRLQAKGATGGGRLMELMTQGQGLAQSTAMPWLQMAGKFGGVDSSSPAYASRNYMEMITRGQNLNHMAAGNRAALRDSQQMQRRQPTYRDPFASTMSQPMPQSAAAPSAPYTVPIYAGRDPRTMSLQELNAELYASSSGRDRGYGIISGDGFASGITPRGQVNLDQYAPQYQDYFSGYGGDYSPSEDPRMMDPLENYDYFSEDYGWE